MTFKVKHLCCLSFDIGQRIQWSIFRWHEIAMAMCLVLMSFQPFKTLSTTLLTNLCWAATQVCRPWSSSKKRNASYDAHIKTALKHTQEVYWQTEMYVHLYFFCVLKSACRAYNQPLSLNQEPSLFWSVRIHGVWRSHLFMNLCEFTLPYRQDAQKMIW